MARIKKGHRSNLGRPPDIGRPEQIGRVGAARLAGNASPAAARGWKLAGARLTGIPGLEDERILAREGLRTTRNPPVQLEQSSQAWTGLAMARGGWRGGAFPGTGVGRFWG